MKTLILFASRYGATEEIAYMLKSAIGGDVTLCNIRDRSISLEGYDTVIIGSCVYMFKLDKHIKRFLRRNEKTLLGKKLGMSQVWDENGFFVPVTLVDVSTNVVTAVKSEESDGYKAVQLGYGQVDPTKVTKPLAGHFAKAGVTPRRHLVEVREDNATEYELGQELTAEVFEEGAEVDVTGTTKGKGFAGTIKRWGFKSYRRTHGSHKNERRPGSVGACATPSRILKGKRMAGRMGHVTNTALNLTIVSSDVENGVLAIKGAIPGPKGSIVLVRSAVKGA